MAASPGGRGGCVWGSLWPCSRRLWQGMLMHSAAALQCQRAGCCLLWGWQRWSTEKLGKGGWSLWGAAGPWGGLSVLSRASFLLLLSAVACALLTLLQPAASLPCTAHSPRPVPAPLCSVLTHSGSLQLCQAG